MENKFLKKMKKTTSTPKELSKKRLANHKIMKSRLDERNDIKSYENENEIPEYPIKPNTTFKKHDKVVADFGIRNPFDVPKQHRIFSKSRGLLKIKSEPFIMTEPDTICDVDHTFFKIIEGRPIRQFHDIKVYMRNIRDITILKANAAYLKDQMIQVDTSFSFENAEYNAIERLFIKCKDSFVKFAEENYTKLKHIQQLAEEKSNQLDAKKDELDSLYFKYVAVRNKLGVLMVNFETLSRYGHFLNSLAPLSWREKNDQWFHGTSVVSAKSCQSKPNVKFVMEYQEPKLFFTQPRQMSLLFDNLSRQCLSYMQIDVFTSGLVASVIKRKNYLRAQVKEEIELLEHLVKAYESYVKFMEGKEQEFRMKFDRVLENEFQVLYSSFDAGKLFTCLQYTNTQVFHGPEDPKDNITMLMLYLEREYLELTSALDNLNQVVVKEATNIFFSEDLKMMKQAYLAQRNLKEYDILSKSLYATFEPPRWKNKK